MFASILLVTLTAIVSLLGLGYIRRRRDQEDDQDDERKTFKEPLATSTKLWKKLGLAVTVTGNLKQRCPKGQLVRRKSHPLFMLKPNVDLLAENRGPEAENLKRARKILRNVGLMEEGIYTKLCDDIGTKELPKGRMLFDHGDEDNCIYHVQSGLLTMFVTDENGREVPVRDFRVDESIFSYLSIIDVLAESPLVFKTLSVVAREDSVVSYLPIKALKEVCDEIPTLKIKIVKTMLMRLLKITFQTLHEFFGLRKELMTGKSKPPLSKKQSRDRLIRNLSSNQTQSFVNEGTVGLKSHAHLAHVCNDLPRDLDTIFEGDEKLHGVGSSAQKGTGREENQGLLCKASQKLQRLLGLENEALIKDHLEIVRYPPRATIISEGSMDANLVYIISGSINWMEVNDQGRDRIAYRLYPGDLLGETSVITGEPQAYTMKAGKAGAVVGLIKGSHIHGVIEKHPDVAIRICHFVVKKTSEFTKQTDFTLEWGILESGQVLYNHKDPADTIFMVLSGRLRSVITRADGTKYIGEEFGRGSLVGIEEVLMGVSRLTAVHAVRNTEITKIPQGTMSYIKRTFPASVTGKVMLAVGNRLSSIMGNVNEGKVDDVNAGDALSKENLSTVVVVPMSDEVPTSAFSRELALKLSKIGSTMRITRSTVTKELGANAFEKATKMRLTSWLNRQEDTHRILLLQAESKITDWTKLCFNQADLILFVEMSDQDPEHIGEMEKELDKSKVGTQRELVLLHTRQNGSYKDPIGTVDWLNSREWCHTVHHIRCPDFMVKGLSSPKELNDNYEINVPDDIGRLSRHLTGTSIGLVLGGGGARGLSHVGFIKAMAESEVPIDVVGGTSIGSFVGACYCSDPNITTLEKMVRLLCRRMSSIVELVLDLTYPYVAMFSGRGFNKIIRDVLGERKIEDLWIPYFCVTTDISDSKMRVHSNGSLWRYVRSSMSLAGYFPPLCDPKDQHLLLDGGYVSNLPVEVMKSRGAGIIFAVDVGGVSDTDFFDFGDEISGWWMVWNKWNPMKRKPKIPDLPEIHNRLSYVANNSMPKLDTDMYHYVRPDIESFGLTMFDKYEEIRDRGHDKGTEILRTIPKWTDQIQRRTKLAGSDRKTENIVNTKIQSVIQAVAKFEVFHQEEYETDEEEDHPVKVQ